MIQTGWVNEHSEAWTWFCQEPDERRRGEEQQDRVQDEVGGGGAGRRVPVEEVRQEDGQEQPKPKVRYELTNVSHSVGGCNFVSVLWNGVGGCARAGTTTAARARSAAWRRGWSGSGTTRASSSPPTTASTTTPRRCRRGDAPDTL